VAMQQEVSHIAHKPCSGDEVAHSGS
jgi:hypothetical protein